MVSFLENVRKDVLDVVFKYISAENSVVFLFGSQAARSASRGSDVDIGLVTGKKLSRSVLSLVRDEMERKVRTLRKIDVIDFFQVDDPGFLKEAFDHIELWHASGRAKEIFENMRQEVQSREK